MKYLVELNSNNVPADFLFSELHLEFGRSPERADDPDILKLRMETGHVAVLCDYDNNRLWITIDVEDDQKYQEVSKRIEKLLEQSKNRGVIEWSQIEIES